jgi:S-formylglutathione hydrolase FrmB
MEGLFNQVQLSSAVTTGAPGGSTTTEQYTVYSEECRKDITVHVMLPPNYASSGLTYPVLYALHGQSSNVNVFSSMSVLRNKMATKPMIVVCFDCDDDVSATDGNGWFVDSPLRATSKFDSFFRWELMPHIETRYRANGVRGVTGFSMGAWGAFHYYSICPSGTFNSVSGMSGSYLNYTDGDTDFMAPVYGAYASNVARYAAIHLTGEFDRAIAAGKTIPPIHLTVGTGSDVEAGSDQLADYFDTKSIDYSETKNPGGDHDFTNWNSANAIGTVCDFHWTNFNA